MVIMKKKRNKLVLRIILLVAIFVVLGILIWMNFFYAKKCDNQECFDFALRDCKRAQFVKQGDISMKYFILGKSGDECDVRVEVLGANVAEVDEERLIGKSMVCKVPLGLVIVPESQIGNCHGLLKEELQDMIIENLHKQIVQNLGEINSDLGY